MRDLFGEPQRSRAQALRTMLWTQVSVIVPGFQGATRVDLPVPCTFDFNVAAVKYFHAFATGEIPLASCSAARFFTADKAERSK